MNKGTIGCDKELIYLKKLLVVGRNALDFGRDVIETHFLPIYLPIVSFIFKLGETQRSIFSVSKNHDAYTDNVCRS